MKTDDKISEIYAEATRAIQRMGGSREISLALTNLQQSELWLREAVRLDQIDIDEVLG